MALPWDALFAAGFAFSGYRTLGRWLQYTDDVAKSQSDGAYLEGFREYLSQAAAAGERAKPNPGAGADASGQGHLWRDFGAMKTKQRLALLQEMRSVLEWTGQDGAYRQLVRHRGKPWASLPHGAKKALLAAADQLDWSFLDTMTETGSAIANSCSLWQITEPLPLLSEEPALAGALLEDASGLVQLVDSADLAVNALLNGQQGKVIAALAPAKDLKVSDVKRQLDLLRELAQGGLGLGSGGKAARGQQLLELLRGLSLTPAEAADADAKAAAAAALDAAADEAVASLRAQHASALAVAVGNARHQAVLAALNSRIKFAPGRPPLSAPLGAAVIGAAVDELTAAAADADAAAAGGPEGGGSLTARRSAAQRIVDTASVIDSAAAALSAALGEDLADGEDGNAVGDALGQLSDSAAALQDAALKLVEAKLSKPAAAAAAVPEGEAGSEAASAADAAGAAAAAAFQDALRAVTGAVAGVSALPAVLPLLAGDSASDEGVTVEATKSEIQGEVAEAVAAAEAKTKQQQEVALQTARSRERMTLLLAKAKSLMEAGASPPPAAAAAAADASGDGSEAPAAAAAEAPMQPAEKLQVTEEFLRQLGARPLAAALTDLERLLNAASGQAGDASDKGPDAAALAAGVALQPESQAGLTQLGQLLSEIQLADGVMKLDLGPDTRKTLAALSAYLEVVHERCSLPQPPETGTPPPSPSQQAAAEKCKPLIEALSSEPLLQLGLSGPQYRTLATLREAAVMLSPELDALKYDRCVTALKDVATQLGPIGATIQTRLAATSDEGLRGVLGEQKALAVELYDCLQAFLTFEQDIRGPLKKCLRELASLAGGIGAPRAPKDCAAAELKLEMAAEEGGKLQALLSQLASSAGEGSFSADVQPPPDSVAATQKVVEALQGSVEAMQAGLDKLSAHVALRARCLNPDVAASAAASGVTAEDLGLESLETMEPELGGPQLTLLASASDEEQGAWEHAGFEHIARGRVAAVLLATATVDAHSLNPRGEDIKVNVADGTPRVAVPVPGLPSGKCVLQLLAERLLKVQQLAAAETFGSNAPVTRQVHWYIMTSPATHAKLASLLRQHAFFGLQPSQVHLFECGTAPPAFAGEPLKALTLGPARLTRGSAGSGEVFAALKTSGMLAHMKRAGIRHVEINAVDDNVLARPADPVLIGFAASEGYDAAAKVVEPDSVAAVYAAASTSGTGPAGAGTEELDKGLLDESISFLAPAIGSYYFSFPALSRVAQHATDAPLAMYRLTPAAGLPSKPPAGPFTVNLPPNATQAQRMQAHQAVVAAQQAAANAPPRQVEGWVPMRCIADVFAGAMDAGSPRGGAGGAGAAAAGGAPLEGCRLAYLGVEKFEEFSVMFSTGPHLAVASLDQAAADLLALTTGWVETQGGLVECDEGVEVAPLVSYAGEDLEAHVAERVFAEPFDAGLQGASAAGKPRHNAGPWAVPVMAAYAVGAALAVAKQLAGNRS